jgi:hypothetical protein
MATLTETAVVARKIIRFAFYGVILLIITRYSYLLGMRIYKSMFPPPPPPPKSCWGKLPSINFQKKAPYEYLTFILETADLSLPELAPQANVYFIPKPFTTIKSVERGKLTAKALGFDPEGRELSDTVFLYERAGDLPSTLTMNVVTNSFSISYDLSSDPNIIYGNPLIPKSAISKAKNYLNKAQLLPDDISSGNPITELIKIENGQFVGVISLSEADLVKVNLFREDYNEIPAKTPDPKQANIWFMVSNKILAGEYHYFELDEKTGCTYPLKTAKDAWNELNTGKAYIADLGRNSDDAEIKIRKVYLAYYDTGDYQEYYQPIIVFEGDLEFVAYAPAISYEYYESQENLPTQNDSDSH